MKKVMDIFEESKYSKFKFLDKYQRPLREKNIKQKIDSIQKIGYKKSNPIIVNNKFQILDGQNRFEALKELGMPIYYVVDNEFNNKDISILNSNVEKWDIDDYMDVHAEYNNNYVKYKNLKIKYGFEHEILIVMILNKFILVGRDKMNWKKFSDEKLIITDDDYNKMESILDELSEFGCYAKIANAKRHFNKGLLELMLISKFDLDYLHTKLGRCNIGDFPFTSIESALYSFFKIYNKGKRKGLLGFKKTRTETVYFIED